MNFPFFIARRYLFSRTKINFINIISIISVLSVAAVAFSTAALIIVLSVFNGLEDLLRTLNNSFDPEIKIQATLGKSFPVSDTLVNRIKKVHGVKVVTEVIEDYAYVRYRDAVQPVIMKGVGDNFIDQNRIPEENIVEGKFTLKEGDVDYAVVGRGVQYTLSIAVNDPMYPLQFFQIKNVKATSLDPSQLYVRKNILASGAFSIVQNFDENYIIVPLEFASELLSYGTKRTYLEIKTTEGSNVFAVEETLQKLLGKKFDVLNHEEQHKDLYRLLKMEKLFTFLALTLLLIIGSINIFFCLMMLALDKKKDISILSSMGASDSQIRNIFLAEGGLIALIGAASGLALGGLFCWIQLRFGIISMGMETSITQGYPIKVNATDLFLALVVVSVITFLISLYPARVASRFAAAKHL